MFGAGTPSCDSKDLRNTLFSAGMTPEKRPAEEEEEQEQAKKLKEDEDATASSLKESVEDDTSQDSVASDSASASDPEKKVGWLC